jgi:hypothetical protein
VVPVQDNDIGAATAAGIQFIQAMFPSVLKQFPT